MQVSKDRLLEIEKELMYWDVRRLMSRDKLIQYNQSKEGRENGREVCSREHHCPHCDTKGGGQGFLGSHFDNCVMKGKDLQELKNDMRTLRRQEVAEKWGISVGYLEKKLSKQYNIKLVNGKSLNTKVSYDCPHCGMKGYGNGFKGLHFDKCAIKGYNLEELLSDMDTLSTNDIKKKYNLTHATFYKIKNYYGKSKKYIR